jgi:hypothetical protein
MLSLIHLLVLALVLALTLSPGSYSQVAQKPVRGEAHVSRCIPLAPIGTVPRPGYVCRGLACAASLRLLNLSCYAFAEAKRFSGGIP